MIGVRVLNMSALKVLALTKYERMGASSRMRTLQYRPFFENAGFDVKYSALFTDELLARRYDRGQYNYFSVVFAYLKRFVLLFRRGGFDVIWIEKEAFPWWPAVIESKLLEGVPYVLDYDDAIFHAYDLHPNLLVKKFFSFRLDGLMKKAALVVGGNRYLAARAEKAGAPWIEVVPTVVDLDRYVVRKKNSPFDVPRIVWIGSPSTARYLNLLIEPLKKLAQEMPFVLKIIGAQGISIPGVTVELVAWSEATEVSEIAECDIGVMPLEDSPWEQGKCGYKLIQYMACGLPVVASAVGANVEIVKDGVNGLLVSTSNAWVDALRILLRSSSRRSQMGIAGRKDVEEKYCIQISGPRLVELLKSAAIR